MKPLRQWAFGLMASELILVPWSGSFILETLPFSVVNFLRVLRIEFSPAYSNAFLDKRLRFVFHRNPIRRQRFSITEHFTEIGETIPPPLRFTVFKKNSSCASFPWFHYLPAVLSSTFRHLSAVVCLHWILYLSAGLRWFPRWSATSLCRAVFSLSSVIDLVTAKKRTDTLGMLAAAVRCRPFQGFLASVILFFARLFLPCLSFSCCCKSTTSAFNEVVGAKFCISRNTAVWDLCSSFRSHLWASLQPVFSPSLGIRYSCRT